MLSKNAKKKYVFGKSYFVIFTIVFLLLPLILYPLVFIDGRTEFSLLVLLEIPWFLIFYFIGLKQFFSQICFSENNLIVKTSKPYSFKENSFSFKINYKDICGLSFGYIDGDRNEEINKALRIYGAPMIILTMNDNSLRHIILYPFSKKQWIQIEKELLNKNHEILVLNSAKDFITNKI